MKIACKKFIKNTLWILAATFFFAGMLFLFSCVKKEEGIFTQDELPLSVGDKVDLMDYFDPRQSIDFTFYSNDQNIFAQVGDEWQAISSGYTYVYAVSEGRQIDSMNIFVKSKFAIPTNISVSESGLIEWDRVYLIVQGEIVDAKYEVIINGGDPIPCESNSYLLAEEGVFDVQVRSLATDEIEASDFSEEISLYYNAMMRLDDLAFVADANGGQQGELSWTAKEENATYEVSVNNIVQNVSLRNNEKFSCTLNLENARPGSDIKLQVLSKDRDGNKRATLSQIIVKKLETIQLDYNDGVFSWDKVTGARGYKIFYREEESQEESFYITDKNEAELLALESGKTYEFGTEALAEEGYANGNSVWYEKSIVKLAPPVATGQIEETKLIISISNIEEYPNRYMIQYGQMELVAQEEITFDGEFYNMRVEILDIEPGEYDLKIKTLPRLDDNNQVIPYNGAEVLSSDYVDSFKLIVLSSAYEMSHSINDNGESVLSFPSIANATAFEVFVNGQPVILAEDAVSILENTTINIGQIDRSQKDIEIVVRAMRNGEILTIASESKKNLTVLDNPIMMNKDGETLGSVDQVTNQYTWQQVENATYEYSLLKTNENYLTEGLEEVWITTQSNHIDEIPEGYYVLRVRSITTDVNNYLTNPSYSEDSFFITKQLDNPTLALGYNDLGTGETYYLLSESVENGYFYDVVIDGATKTIASEGDAKCLLNNELFNDLQPHTFSVRVRGKDSKIYLTSDYSSEMTIAKLASPEILKVSDEEVATISLPSGAEKLEIPENGLNETNSEPIIYEEDAQIDLSKRNGDINLHISALGLKKEELSTPIEGEEIYLQSETAILRIHRSATPTNLKYSNGAISFEHSDLADSYVISITLTTINGDVKKEKTLGSNTKEFNLKEFLGSDFSEVISFEMSVRAQISRFEGETYYLSSRELGNITVGRLAQIKHLQFDKVESKITWSDSQGATYHVYKNDEEIDETTDQYYIVKNLDAGKNTFYVIATKDDKIDSAQSNKVVLNQLKTIDKINVGYSSEKLPVDNYYATFDISTFTKDYISSIEINNKANKTEILQENLPDIITIENLDGDVKIVVKGKTEVETDGIKYYYLDSTSNFELKNIATDTYSANIQNGKITWTYPIEADYEVLIYQGGSFVKSKIVSGNELSLDDTFFAGIETNGNYTIKVNALAKSKAVQNGSNGLFGTQTITDNLQIVRFEQVSNLKTSYDTTSISTAEGETTKSITLSWSWKKPDSANSDTIKFMVYLNEESLDSINYTQDTSNYSLPVSKLQEGENTITLVVYGEKDIPASTSIKIERYKAPNLTISDDGLITITTENQPESKVEKYIIDMMQGEMIVKTFSVDATGGKVENSTALKDILNDSYSGEYTFKVVAQGLSGGMHATSELATISKTILSKPSYKIVSGGKVQFTSNDEGVSFSINSIKVNDANIDSLQPDSEGIFTFPDEWEAGAYTFNVTATKQGCISSYPVDLSVTLERVNAVESVNIQRVGDSEQISWARNDDVNYYILSVFFDENKFGEIKLTNPSITIAELENTIGTLPAGELNFSIVCFGEAANSVLQSISYNFSLNKLAVDKITSFGADEKGMLAWQDVGENHEGYGLRIRQDGSSTIINLEKVNVWEPNLAAGEYKISIKRLGNVGTTATTIGEETITYLDSSFTSFITVNVNEKLRAVQGSAFLPLTGQMQFTSTNIGEELKIFIKYKNKIWDITDYRLTSEKELTFRVADIMEKIGAGSSDLSFNLYTTIGSLKSLDSEFSLSEYSKGASLEIFREAGEEIKISSFEDLMSYSDPFSGNLSNLIIRIGKLKDENMEYSYKLLSGVGISKDFENIRKVNVLLDLLGLTESGEYNISISCGKSGENGTYRQSSWTEPVSVDRLVAIDSVQNIRGNITWTDKSDRSDTIYGFILYAQNVADPADIISKIYQQSDNKYFDVSVLGKDKKYNIYVVAVSTENKQVISVKTFLMDGASVANAQRANPNTGLSLVDGSLSLGWGESNFVAGMTEMQAFESGNFLTVLEAYQNNKADNKYAFANRLAAYQFVSPISFTVKTLTETYLQLIFKTSDNQQVINVPATQLLSRLGQKYINILGNIVAETGNNTLRDFYKLLQEESLFTGVANKNLIFDDMGDFAAENIQAGNYNIFLRQINTTENSTILDSGEIVGLENITVQNSPKTSTSVSETKIFSDNIGSYNLYYLEFTPLNNISDYTLVLKDVEGSEVYAFDITYYTEAWKLNNLTLEFDNNKVKILLNSKGGNLGLDSLIANGAYGRGFTANIYAKGNSENILNGKSENISINFMGMNPFSVVEGELKWKTYSVNGTRISARVESISSTVTTTRGNDNTSYYPNEAGTTGTIKITTNGSRSDYTINVESQTYVITDTQACYSPELSVNDGFIKIKNNANNPTIAQYRIGNSQADLLAISFLTEPFAGIYTYQPGVNYYNGDPLDNNTLTKEKESSAESFYVYNIGVKEISEKAFTYSKPASGIINVNSSQIIFRSARKNLPAKMIEEPQGLTINENGDFTWDMATASTGEKFNENENITYAVEVYYYTQSQDSNGNYVYTLRRVDSYQTVINVLEKEKIYDFNDGETYFYRFSVRAYATNENATYEKGTTILTSEIAYLPARDESPMSRLEEVTSFSIDNGKLSWSYNKFVEDKTNIQNGTKFELSYRKVGAEEVKSLAGSWERQQNKFIFTESKNEFEANTAYDIFIQVLQNECMPSNKTVISNVYKLQSLQADQFTVEDAQGGGEYISLENYFNSILLQNRNTVEVKVMNNGKELFSLNRLIPRFKIIIDSSMTGMYVDTNNREIYLKDVTSGINLSFLAISKGDRMLNSETAYEKVFSKLSADNIKDLIWNEEIQKFTWTSELENVSYDVEILTLNTAQEGRSTIKTYETRQYFGITENSFSPTLMGDILEFKVRIRTGESDLASEWLEYSEASAINFYLFNGGDGTKNNPYQVSNADQFRLISAKLSKDSATATYKQRIYKEITTGSSVQTTGTSYVTVTEEDRYYFKQTEDIVFGNEQRETSFVIEGSFSGNYDGNNKTITFYAQGMQATTQTQIMMLSTANTSNSASFSYGLALFQEIGSAGEIKNLNVKFDYLYTLDSNSGPAIISGLALISYGNIEDVTAVQTRVQFSGGFATRTIAISGLVGINRGTMKNCVQHSDNILIDSRESNNSCRLYVAGVVLANYSKLINCGNFANISANLSSSQDSVVQIAGVALVNLNAKASMQWCFNEGNLTCQNTRGAGYVGGLIVLSNSSSTIEYSFNSADISSSSKNVTGAIAVSLAQCNISNVVCLGNSSDGAIAANESARNDSNVYRNTNYISSTLSGSLINQAFEISDGIYIMRVFYNTEGGLDVNIQSV